MTRRIFILAALLCFLTGGAAERVFKPSFPRPAFDKSAYRKTVWSTANPWWPPNLSHNLYDKGGPDYSWDKFSDDRIEMWKQVAQRYHASGLTGIQMETASYVSGAQETAYGFAESGTGMTVIPFMQVHGKTADEATAFMLKTFGKFKNDLWEHSGFYRLDGRPVVFIYRATKYDAEFWKQIIPAVEAKYGNMIWLFDAALVGVPEGQWLPKLRDMLQYFDGISMYGNWSAGTQQKLFDMIAPVMKKEFPQKIFEGGVHTNYTNHHWYGGVDPELTSKYRGSWEMVLAAEPDSVSVTNWFDILENSRIMPSYELEDIRLKILEYYTARWRGGPVPATKEPLIYAVYPTHVLLGQYMPVELVVFPVTGPSRDLRMQLEFYAEDDKKVRTFIKDVKTSDKDLTVVRFNQLMDAFAEYNGLYPRLRFRWDGKWELTPVMPHVNLSTSIRPRLLFWARSNQRLLQVSASSPWTLGGVPAGMTLALKSNPVLVRGSGKSIGVRGMINRGGNQVRIMRNWRQFREFEFNGGLDFVEPQTLPPARSTLDWYNLELSNGYGAKYLSPPIWVHDGSRDRLVDLPIYSLGKKEVKVIKVKDYRVPFFRYECATDDGPFVLDSSGNEHHGSLAPDWRRGALYRTSYRYEHSSAMPASARPQAVFKPSLGGKPALYFDGTGYAAFMGGTAFPYSFTYEMYLLPDSVEKEQDVFGSGNGQISMGILAGGKIIARRGQAVEGAGGEKLTAKTSNHTAQVVSESAVSPGKWVHVAVVYDLRELKLFINGKLEGKAPLEPSRNGEWLNAVVVGGKGQFPYRCEPQYKGGIRRMRFCGRPLQPEEFWLDRD